MALLYEHSKTWRWIVQKTKNPVFLAGFSVVCCGTFGGLGYLLYSNMPESTTVQDIEQIVAKDDEARRYANHSRDALASMFAQIKGEDKVEPGFNKVKLPEIMWHPKAIERDEKQKKAKTEAQALTIAQSREKGKEIIEHGTQG